MGICRVVAKGKWPARRYPGEHKPVSLNTGEGTLFPDAGIQAMKFTLGLKEPIQRCSSESRRFHLSTGARVRGCVLGPKDEP